MENGRKLFKQMKDSSKVDIEHFREFRKGVRNEARSLKPEKRKEFEEDFDRSGVGGLNGI